MAKMARAFALVPWVGDSTRACCSVERVRVAAVARLRRGLAQQIGKLGPLLRLELVEDRNNAGLSKGSRGRY